MIKYKCAECGHHIETTEYANWNKMFELKKWLHRCSNCGHTSEEIIKQPGEEYK